MSLWLVKIGAGSSFFLRENTQERISTQSQIISCRPQPQRQNIKVLF
jgi:hypothetical protein